MAEHGELYEGQRSKSKPKKFEVKSIETFNF